MTEQQTARRTIVSGQSTTTSVAVTTQIPLHDWLAQQAISNSLRTLLLHAETGVVWGELRTTALALSAGSALDWAMLQQARLFGDNAELFVWQGPQGWCARLIEDGKGSAVEWIDECQMLWGNRAETSVTANTGFTPIVEGSQGIVHAPPIGDNVPTEQERAQLKVRHYFGEDDAGVVRVTHSRVLKLLKPG